MNDHHRIEKFSHRFVARTTTVLPINLIVFSVILALFAPGIFTVFALAVLYACWVLVFLKKKNWITKDSSGSQGTKRNHTTGAGHAEIKLNGVERSHAVDLGRFAGPAVPAEYEKDTLNQWQQAEAVPSMKGRTSSLRFFPPAR